MLGAIIKLRVMLCLHVFWAAFHDLLAILLKSAPHAEVCEDKIYHIQ